MKALALLRILVMVSLIAPAAGALAQSGDESEAFVLVATALLNNSGYRRTVHTRAADRCAAATSAWS